MIKKFIGEYVRRSRCLSSYFLKIFINLHNYSYHKISEYATVVNNGIHPKVDIVGYQEYFYNKISRGERIVDIGCGRGHVSHYLADKASKITAIDINKYNIKKAKESYNDPNVKYIVGDATSYIFNGHFDKIILSNVLEHIRDRVVFLIKLKALSDTILLRVPMLDRSWLAMYKYKNGFEYRLDKTHQIEYTMEALFQELERSGWELIEYNKNWAELWGVLKAKH